MHTHETQSYRESCVFHFIHFELYIHIGHMILHFVSWIHTLHLIFLLSISNLKKSDQKSLICQGVVQRGWYLTLNGIQFKIPKKRVEGKPQPPPPLVRKCEGEGGGEEKELHPGSQVKIRFKLCINQLPSFHSQIHFLFKAVIFHHSKQISYSLPTISPFSLSDQDRISPNNINTISSRQVINEEYQLGDN